MGVLVEGTSNQHSYYAEYLLGERVGRHVAEADAGERRARKVQSRHITLAVRYIRYRHFQSLRQIVYPS